MREIKPEYKRAVRWQTGHDVAVGQRSPEIIALWIYVNKQQQNCQFLKSNFCRVLDIVTFFKDSTDTFFKEEMLADSGFW